MNPTLIHLGNGNVSTKVLHEFTKTPEVSILLGFFFVYRFKEVSKKLSSVKEVNYNDIN
jgi:hypothetical protein